MRKRLIEGQPPKAPPAEQPWLPVEDLAEVEFSSEDAAHPIEHAFLPAGKAGWRAAGPGAQTIRLVFAQPPSIRLIHLNFIENLLERTQEYVLRWSPDHGQSYREIVRQQWHFSPSGATAEREEHHVDLAQVTMLELHIVPDISGGNALASLEQWRIA